MLIKTCTFDKHEHCKTIFIAVCFNDNGVSSLMMEIAPKNVGAN